MFEAALNTGDQMEALSREDLLTKIDKLNEEWKDQGVNHKQEDITVASVNASLDTRDCSKLCGKMVAE